MAERPPIGPERDRVKPSELVTAARIADALVFAAGAAGVIAGGLFARDGQIGFAVVAWALTFVAGVGLRLAAWGARALAELLVRSRHLEDEVARLRTERPAEPPPSDEQRRPRVDPYRRWGGHW